MEKPRSVNTLPLRGWLGCLILCGSHIKETRGSIKCMISIGEKLGNKCLIDFQALCIYTYAIMFLSF